MINSKNKNFLIANRAYVKSDGCKSQYADATVLINKVSDLSVTKTSNCDRFEVNEIITYIINVKNNGPSRASGVVLKDILPPLAIFESICLSQGCFTLKKGYIICYLGNINTGDSVIVNLKIISKENCPIINSVFVIGNEFDPKKENNMTFLELYNNSCEKNDFGTDLQLNNRKISFYYNGKNVYTKWTCKKEF